MPSVSKEHIEIVEGAGGPKARIAGSRIRVMDVATWHENMGMTADEIANEFPTITLADVYAALAYYWDNRAAIEEAMTAEDTFVEELRRRSPSVLADKMKRHQSA
jgi:uncharacterized protein (DUF433 family)